jgi:uncharacterized membrane protein
VPAEDFQYLRRRRTAPSSCELPLPLKFLLYLNLIAARPGFSPTFDVVKVPAGLARSDLQGGIVIELLIIGLVIFFGIHLVPAAPALHDSLVRRMGKNGWKLVMSLVAIAGFVMIVRGWQRAPFVSVYLPPEWGHWLPRILMLPALVLLAAAYIPSNVKRFTRHPMLWATVVWAVAHLFANGDRRSLLLFGSFAVWALFDMWSANRRGAALKEKTVRLGYEAAVVVTGVVAYALFARFHGALFGVPVMAQ